MVQSPAMADVRTLYQRMVRAWNAQDAVGFASCLAPQGLIIGYDGSKMVGRAGAESSLGEFFRAHPTARFVTIERKIRMLSPTVALYVGDVGMVPRGQHELNPAANARQTMIAVRQGDHWAVELFQSSPAPLHGGPDLALALNEELKETLSRQLMTDP